MIYLGRLRLYAFSDIDNQHHEINNLGTYREITRLAGALCFVLRKGGAGLMQVWP